MRPYLKSWYMGVKYDPHATSFDGMDSAATVESADVENWPRQPMEERERMGLQHANWIAQAREHWQEHRPRMFARLTKAGTLDQALTEAAAATARAIRVLTTQGATREEAWEATREQYLFPPEEPEQTPRMRKSQGYRDRLELQRMMAALGQPED